MSTDSIKVGDVVAWKNVPDGALVRTAAAPDFGYDQDGWAVRRGDRGLWVCDEHHEVRWSVDGPDWGWYGAEDAGCTGETTTIVAIGLTGQESADDLQRLAEVFEVREALGDLDSFEMPADLAHALEEQAEDDDDGARDALACILHAAGWRPGMTAEDAARLLTEADR